MDPHLRATLEILRAHRGFDAERCIAAKLALLCRYFQRSGLTAAVVGVSGGVDSAVVLALLARAARASGSPIRRVLAVLAPYRDLSQGVSNQALSSALCREAALACAAECVELDLSAAHATTKRSVEQALGLVGGPWADGQLVSNLRTPALYQVVTLLTQSGHPGALVGTTTRDEGAYIGYFGKASDGLCDIQAISDLHKSEVYALARSLAVPTSILEAEPTGDIWDGRTDHELIGVPFVAVELHTLLLCRRPDERAELMSTWTPAAHAAYTAWAARIEQLHRENLHKYHGGSPALHLDIHERAVPGGWRIDSEPAPTPPNNFVNEVPLRPALVAQFNHRTRLSELHRVQREDLPGFGESAVLLHDVLDADERDLLLAALAEHPWLPVGVDGRRAGFDPEASRVGSLRLSIFSHDLARALWTRIAPHLPAVRLMDPRTPTDHDDHPVWRAIGVNPLLRLIRYPPGGALVPHFDSTFIETPRERTLMSLVLGLAGRDSATRFIRDPHAGTPHAGREYADWTSFAAPGDVLRSIPVPPGSALIFDHRQLHDSAPITDSIKVVLRTDLRYLRCGPAPERMAPSHLLGRPRTPEPPP